MGRGAWVGAFGPGLRGQPWLPLPHLGNSAALTAQLPSRHLPPFAGTPRFFLLRERVGDAKVFIFPFPLKC